MDKLLLISGVARSGTTSLFHYLGDIGLVSKNVPKEPKFITRNFYENLTGKGDAYVKTYKASSKEEYFELINCGDISVDASSDLFYRIKDVTSELENVSSEFEDPSIVVVLRNPFERTVSAYKNMVRDDRESLTFERALSIEQERINNGYDWMWHYINGSLYSERLEYIFKRFNKVKIILFDDLISDPKKVISDLLVFLGLNLNDFNIDKIEDHVIYSSSKQIKWPWNILTARSSSVTSLVRLLIIKAIPRKTLERIARLIQNDSGKNELIWPGKVVSLLNEDIERCETVLGLDLSKWKR